MKCVRQHPAEVIPRAMVFRIESFRDLACHYLQFGSPPLKNYFIAITFEFDLFSGVHPGAFCLSVRRGSRMTAYTFHPNDGDFVKYVKDQIKVDDELNFRVMEGSDATIHYFPVKPKLPVNKPILFFAHSELESDLFVMFTAASLAYYQYPKAGYPLEGADDF
uniref:VP9 n=1 Tax=Callinectes sapidus reovirus 2 TaxID=2789658 RepID=A0A8K1HPA9_9REOV|nr:VP9 [Callinectes sapidus reovirus 2]